MKTSWTEPRGRWWAALGVIRSPARPLSLPRGPYERSSSITPLALVLENDCFQVSDARGKESDALCEAAAMTAVWRLSRAPLLEPMSRDKAPPTSHQSHALMLPELGFIQCDSQCVIRARAPACRPWTRCKWTQLLEEDALKAGAVNSLSPDADHSKTQ